MSKTSERTNDDLFVTTVLKLEFTVIKTVTYRLPMSAMMDSTVYTHITNI